MIEDGTMKHSGKVPAYRHYRLLFEAGSFSGLTDGELLAYFVNGKADSAELAFAALVERHAAKVLRICRAVVRNEHDAEDAFQATFLVLATKATKLRARESLGPWLFAVARRVSAGARARALGRVAREQRAARNRAERLTRAEIGDDDSSILYEEIDSLPERYRLPLLLCDMESQTHQEAARRLGWPVGTVKSRQARGRQRLRARLTRRGLSGALGLLGSACAARTARAQVPASLVDSTARIAAGFISTGSAGRVVSASVSTLVTNTLRAMIMKKVTMVMGVLLTLSAGAFATVLAQAPKPKSAPAPANSAPVGLALNPAASSNGGPNFEYEIRIWKNGAPLTPTMKMKVVPGEVSQLKIAEGTLDVRFQPRNDSEQAAAKPNRTNTIFDLVGTPNSAESLAALLALSNEINAKNNPTNLNNLAEVIDDGNNAEVSRLAALAAANSNKTAPAVNDNHEKRLREIERKLEQILNALDRSAAKRPESNHRELAK
jgi:RNA polymerase sigma factor (sigma-70 family)